MQRKQPCKIWKNSSSEEYISHHMSSHYRRILNAKKIVDTSAPQSYKAKVVTKGNLIKCKRDNQQQNKNVSPAVTERSVSTNSYKASSWGADSVVNSSRFHTNCIPEDLRAMYRRKKTAVDMDLINHIVYDTKNPPAVYCDDKWSATTPKDSSKRQNLNTGVKTGKSKTAVHTPKQVQSVKVSGDLNQALISIQRKSSKVMSKQTQSYASFGSKTRPKKNEAVSKLRSLRVYYPPRRKKKRDESEHSLGITHAIQDKRLEICICSTNGVDVKKRTAGGKEQTSSRDSAYNGGVSSLPESRSPTPDHRTIMLCACEGRNESKQSCYYDEEETKSEEKPQSVKDMPSVEPKSKEEDFKKIKEDALYVKFVQDITVEILEKGLFTNKALKNVMRKHMINNMDSLNKDRMIKEVENLRIQLGIPEDKNLLNLDENIDENSSIISKAYPVISDSAFTLPESLCDEKKIEKNINNDIFELKGGSESDLDTNDEDDSTDIINIPKKLRDRISTNGQFGKQKKRPKVRRTMNLKNNFHHSIGSSSSESDRSSLKSENESRKKQIVVNKFRKTHCTCEENDGEENKQFKLIVYSQDCQKIGPKPKSMHDIQTSP